MKINHYFHDDRIVVEIKPKDREDFEKIMKFIEFAELNAENENVVKRKEEKETWDID